MVFLVLVRNQRRWNQRGNTKKLARHGSWRALITIDIDHRIGNIASRRCSANDNPCGWGGQRVGLTSILCDLGEEA